MSDEWPAGVWLAKNTQTGRYEEVSVPGPFEECAAFFRFDHDYRGEQRRCPLCRGPVSVDESELVGLSVSSHAQHLVRACGCVLLE